MKTIAVMLGCSHCTFAVPLDAPGKNGWPRLVNHLQIAHDIDLDDGQAITIKSIKAG